MSDQDWEEYQALKEQQTNISGKFLDILKRKDLDEATLNNRVEKMRSYLNELSERIKILTAPALKEIDRRNKEYEKEQQMEQDILERAKSDESFQIKIENAIDAWPRTEYPNLAGYIMRDGDLLSMSYTGHNRDVDHREITQDIDELSGGTMGMRQFMYATGAIRMHAPSGDYVSFDWYRKPTRSQIRRMIEIASGASDISVSAEDNNYQFDHVSEMIDVFRWY